jgi:hypothetical protein
MILRRARGRSLRLATALVVAGVVGVGAYAYTASNSVPATQAGEGATAISGYTTSAVQYTLNSSDPTKIDAVAFTISPTTGTVKAQLVSSGSWYSCTNSSGSVSCATTSPQATVSTANQLTVVAAQ